MDNLCNDLESLSSTAKKFIAEPKGIYIGGSWRPARSGNVMPVIDPSSGQQIATVQKASREDVDDAVAAAGKALRTGEWPNMQPAARERLILRFADLFEANGPELAQLESIDNGKAATHAQFIDVGLCVNFLRYMAGFTTKSHGRTMDLSVPYAQDANFFAYTQREPVGVVGAIIPWNMPMLMAVWKLGPALASGCTIVLKPASDTPLTALRIAELIDEAGFPPGVVNVITGPGGEIGNAMVTHPDINKIAFTGSTDVGKDIGRAGVDTMKRISLELGGKSPMIVLNDADLEMTIPGIMLGMFANCGQVCAAGTRLYVQSGIYDHLMPALEGAAKAMKVGPGLDPATEMGPVVSAAQKRTVEGYIAAGLEEGAELVVGGQTVDAAGYYVQPTVFAQTDHSMKIVNEEIFGPVLSVMRFETEEDVVAKANDTPYGLAASVFSTNNSAIQRLVPQIKAGTVWVNCHNIFDAGLPFGGYKDSGIGREMGEEVMGLYSEVKSVCVAY